MTENKSQIFAFRALDAAINRAAEGLRVIEDHQRMVLNNRFLTGQLKAIRHELIEGTKILDLKIRLAARDTLNDVGAEQGYAGEYRRSSASEVLEANFSRVQQALRSIEEFSKTISPELAQQVERLRFRTYTLQKSVMKSATGAELFSGTYVYVLVDGRQSLEDFCSLVQKLIEGGVKLIQFRDKRLSERELVLWGRRLTELLEGYSISWIMNDRVDLAIAAGADGVHLGQDDLALADARPILGIDKLIGVSTHNIEQAREAVLQGADYIGVGPVFPSTSKSFDEFPGLGFVSEVASEIALPAFAIGGISDANVAQVVDAGLRRVAVRGSIIDDPDPAAALARLQKRLNADELG